VITRDPAHSRVTFVNRYYWPDELATAQLLTDLAEGLAARGWRSNVIASHDGRATIPERETRNGVGIVRVRASRRGRRLLAAKALDYLTFTRAARRTLRSTADGYDWLVAMTDPPTLTRLAASVARQSGARLVHWIQDIHPEISLALSGSRLLAALCGPWIRRRDAAWRQAHACVAISRDMANLVREHGVPAEQVRIIPNWAVGGAPPASGPPAENPLRHEWNLKQKFVVAYSGNLGRVHALEPVLAAAELLRDHPDLVFLFIGDGPCRPALEATARSRCLDNVRFLPPQPRARLADSLAVADLHLVTLRSGCERCVFPSKLYGILAAARPVLFLGPRQSQLAEEVGSWGAGVAMEADSPPRLAAVLRELQANEARLDAMARAAARWSNATGGLKSALNAWDELFQAG
jgi:colanic acid biosynthesis glycosyl transferase WcaI